MPLRADLVFSYWIFIWYLLYIFHFTIYNPKFAIMLGLIDNIIMFLMMILYGTSIKNIIFFIIINIFIKVIPYYYLMDKPIKYVDIYVTVIIFIIFILWLHINKESLTGNIRIIYDSLLYDKNTTPIMNILSNLKNNYKHLEIV